MVDDGLYERFPRRRWSLVRRGPLPPGCRLRAGPAVAAADAVRVTLYGRGGHGSRPEDTVDPVVMAAAVVMRLQTLVSVRYQATIRPC